MTKANKPDWLKKIARNMINYYIYFIYLACFFCVFTLYRSLVLAQYKISYFNYGVSLLEAMVLAKVIMLGEIFHLGSKLKNKPLIITILYKSIIFTVWVGIFGTCEHTIPGIIKGNTISGSFEDFFSVGWHELLARCLVVFFAFIPFFAFKELGLIIGKGRLQKLFFKKSAFTELAQLIGNTK